MFKIVNFSNRKGRPRKKRGFNLNSIDSINDDYMKTIVLNIRVSESEKNYLKNVSSSKSYNISSYIRRLIFDVYFYKLKDKDSLTKNQIINGEYAFNEPRNKFIYIRLTEVEKKEVERLAIMNHRSVSEFIRWLCIQLPIDELLNC